MVGGVDGPEWETPKSKTEAEENDDVIETLLTVIKLFVLQDRSPTQLSVLIPLIIRRIKHINISQKESSRGVFQTYSSLINRTSPLLTPLPLLSHCRTSQIFLLLVDDREE